MKKLLSLLLVFVMVLSLAACGPKQETPQEPTTGTDTEKPAETPAEEPAGEEKPYAGKTLKVAGLNGGYGTKAWLEVIAKFEEVTGAKVESQFEKNIYEVIRPQIQDGNAPDVIYNSVGQESGLTETMLKEDMVLDITDVFSTKIIGEEKAPGEKIVPGFTGNATTNPKGDDKVYLAPLFYSPTGLWYNKAQFIADGGKYELPKTMDEFLALGETAKADGVALFTYPTTGYFDTFSFALASAVGGTDLFNRLMNYDVEAWKTEATPIFETIGKILQYVHPNTVAQANNEGFTKNQLSVMTNETLFMPNGTWIVGEMASAEGVAEGFKWGFMALPSIGGGERYATSWFEQAFVTKDSKEPELAKAFVGFLYSDEAIKLFLNNTIVNDKGETVASPQVQPVVGVESMIEDPDNKLFYSIYSDGANATLGGFAAAPAVEGVDMSKSLFEAVNSVANGDMTVQEWQAGVVDTATKLSEAIKAQ
ncbi:MAG: carbohydrate ABC transporter substrate-binding protein [Tissierellia bacterium]|nr:carbohydrate ABC transporter substrate-binding protein [Tissierellia bacterium]